MAKWKRNSELGVVSNCRRSTRAEALFSYPLATPEHRFANSGPTYASSFLITVAPCRYLLQYLEKLWTQSVRSVSKIDGPPPTENLLPYH
jgi:hypothetical protein